MRVLLRARSRSGPLLAVAQELELRLFNTSFIYIIRLQQQQQVQLQKYRSIGRSISTFAGSGGATVATASGERGIHCHNNLQQEGTGAACRYPPYAKQYKGLNNASVPPSDMLADTMLSLGQSATVGIPQAQPGRGPAQPRDKGRAPNHPRIILRPAQVPYLFDTSIGRLYLLFKQGIAQKNTLRAWIAFSEIIDISIKYMNAKDYVQMLHLLNRTYTELRYLPVLDMTQGALLNMQRGSPRLEGHTALLNELLRVLVARKKVQHALKLKEVMLLGQSGGKPGVDVLTYAALFAGLNPASREDLLLGVRLYEEMTALGIRPSIQIVKVLVRSARKCGEDGLLRYLLEWIDKSDVSKGGSLVAQKVRALSVKSWLYLGWMTKALDELRKMASIPFSPTLEPESIDDQLMKESISNANIINTQRKRFYYIMRSAYAAVIRYCLKRRLHKLALTVLEEYRQSSLLPPSQVLYGCLVNYYARKKMLNRLERVLLLMEVDDVQPTVEMYEEAISACMRIPSDRYLVRMAQAVRDRCSVASSQQQKQQRGEDAGDPQVLQPLVELQMVEAARNSIFAPRLCTKLYRQLLQSVTGSSKVLLLNPATFCSVIRAHDMLGDSVGVLTVYDRMHLRSGKEGLFLNPKIPRKRVAEHTNEILPLVVKACNQLGQYKRAGAIQESMLCWGVH
ncbi:hypothetical protein EV182_001265 [Spiromyces aspiralis]|uniref:Uncharacterized protein n=1 Tax=Spiromyces aspiralis TaxID=68401 RepID=A0ACC1HM94_9FUNG|nr:hypothetical protein EV182_001265 [Spiromyces aspiralis]